jgi:NRPS condensation-like uncharacterized protein
MARKDIHVGNTVKLRYTIKENGTAKNISSYTSERTLWLRRPDGTTVSKTLSFSSDGTDGKVEYQCASTDLDVKGEWESQVYLKASASDVLSSSFVTFPVRDNLNPDNDSPL